MNNLNLSVNPLLREIDTIMFGQKPDHRQLYALAERLRAILESLKKDPDADIPNNIFIGVSNETRKMVIGSFACIVAQEMHDAIQAKFSQLNDETGQAGGKN